MRGRAGSQRRPRPRRAQVAPAPGRVEGPARVGKPKRFMLDAPHRRPPGTRYQRHFRVRASGTSHSVHPHRPPGRGASAEIMHRSRIWQHSEGPAPRPRNKPRRIMPRRLGRLDRLVVSQCGASTWTVCRPAFLARGVIKPMRSPNKVGTSKANRSKDHIFCSAVLLRHLGWSVRASPHLADFCNIWPIWANFADTDNFGEVWPGFGQIGRHRTVVRPNVGPSAVEIGRHRQN